MCPPNKPSDKSTLRIDLVDLAGPARNQGTRDVPSLTVLTGPSFGEFFPISEQITVVGRSSECDIRVDDASISRKHARLLRSEHGHFIVEDLGSSNGTYVNGEPVRTPTVLKEGDKVTLGKLTILRFSFNDAFDAAFQRRLYDAALRDGLTHAFNKRYLVERLTMELSFARRHRSSLTVVIFDVDHFKRINDDYGHLAGDTVLVQLVECIQTILRTEDILARYGGEEFVVVCRGIPVEHSFVVGERIRTAIERHDFDHKGTKLPVTVSVGIASYPAVDAKTPQQLVGAADLALYAAKGGGRNQTKLAA